MASSFQKMSNFSWPDVTTYQAEAAIVFFGLQLRLGHLRESMMILIIQNRG
jgi:hypothetical protein